MLRPTSSRPIPSRSGGQCKTILDFESLIVFQTTIQYTVIRTKIIVDYAKKVKDDGAYTYRFLETLSEEEIGVILLIHNMTIVASHSMFAALASLNLIRPLPCNLCLR